MSNIQRHRIHTIILVQKGGNQYVVKKYWIKVRLKPNRKNPRSYTSGSGSVGLDDSTYPALLPATHLSFLGWFCSLPAAILGRHLMALASPTSRGCFLDASPARGVLPWGHPSLYPNVDQVSPWSPYCFQHTGGNIKRPAKLFLLKLYPWCFFFATLPLFIVSLHNSDY